MGVHQCPCDGGFVKAYTGTLEEHMLFSQQLHVYFNRPHSAQITTGWLHRHKVCKKNRGRDPMVNLHVPTFFGMCCRHQCLNVFLEIFCLPLCPLTKCLNAVPNHRFQCLLQFQKQSQVFWKWVLYDINRISVTYRTFGHVALTTTLTLGL